MTGCWAAAGLLVAALIMFSGSLPPCLCLPRTVSSPQSSHSPATHDTNSMIDARLIFTATFFKTSIVVVKIISLHFASIFNKRPGVVSEVHFKATVTGVSTGCMYYLNCLEIHLWKTFYWYICLPMRCATAAAETEDTINTDRGQRGHDPGTILQSGLIVGFSQPEMFVI